MNDVSKQPILKYILRNERKYTSARLVLVGADSPNLRRHIRGFCMCIGTVLQMPLGIFCTLECECDSPCPYCAGPAPSEISSSIPAARGVAIADAQSRLPPTPLHILYKGSWGVKRGWKGGGMGGMTPFRATRVYSVAPYGLHVCIRAVCTYVYSGVFFVSKFRPNWGLMFFRDERLDVYVCIYAILN